jgi:hypothetical protein
MSDPDAATGPDYPNRGAATPPPNLPPIPEHVEVVEVPAGGPPEPEPDPELQPAESRGFGDPRPVLAFFYPWYDTVAFEPPPTGKPMTFHPVEPYLSDDIPVMLRQIREAQRAQIDGFISSWAGSGDPTDRNFAQLLDRCPDGFYACPYFETSLVLGRG